jgi:hypothetical protein
MPPRDPPPAPTDGLPPGGLARAYQRVRNGKAFAIGLAVFVAAWWTAQFTHWAWDPDLGQINFLLSVEASLSQALTFTMLAGLLGLVLKLLRDIENMARRLLELLELERDVAMARADRAAARPRLGGPD